MSAPSTAKASPASPSGQVSEKKMQEIESPAEPAPVDDGAASADSAAAPPENGAGEKSATAQVIPGTQAAQERSTASQKPTVRYLSADDSNSAASPVIARKLIREGKYVPPAVVRTYEFLNYYHFDYPAPEEKELRIIPQMRMLEDGQVSLQVALRGKDLEESDRKPFNVTFLVDTSGSMAGPSLNLAKLFLTQFAEKLRQGDVLSIVSFNRTPEILLDSHQVGSDTIRLLRDTVLPQLIPDNVTDIGKGIEAAFSLARKNYSYKFLNRVVVLSDGAANAGEMAEEVIGKYAEDSDRQGIYLAGIGLGEGFNDSLMNALTDKGRGAFLFIDTKEEISRILSEPDFIANFDLALKNIRLKMILPPGWRIAEFHGEQMSENASDIVPQYLSPNDQMIYHMNLTAPGSLNEFGNDTFEFEAEYTPLQGSPKTAAYKAAVANMIADQRQILKGDAVTEFAEMLKAVKYPLEQYAAPNREAFASAFGKIRSINETLGDPELGEIIELCGLYESVIARGEQFPGSLDRYSESIPAVLGIPSDSLLGIKVAGDATDRAIRGLSRLGGSVRLKSMEGYKFLVLSNGPVEAMEHTGSGQLSNRTYRDPKPEYSGRDKIPPKNQSVFDLHQVSLTLKAPAYAKSFSFDFNFFSAEYPDYVQQNYNDTFYAILKAASTNGGKSTNISFDAAGNSIEVDNNYFENPFHPIPNNETGYDGHGSTGWLKTAWPIRGGEEFTLTFSIHDEGDGIYDSAVLLDNFSWNSYPAVGTTDPIN